MENPVVAPVAKETSGAFAQLVSFIPNEYRLILGIALGGALVVAGPMLIYGSLDYLTAATKKAKEASPGCWTVQQAGERVFKINSCTGESVELQKAPPSK